MITVRSTSVPDPDRLLWQERSLVKTRAMRGTLHLLPADELGTWIAAMRRRERRITPAWGEVPRGHEGPAPGDNRRHPAGRLRCPPDS
ncbi:MAG: DNA glycosylase AlkZ-like family protein [Acidimicrobiia bacterium]